MKDKKVVVCLKYFKGELNPFDGAALECALEAGFSNIVALTMSPPSASGAFESLARLGVRCVMLSDGLFAGSDTQATSLVLAKAIFRLQPDYVFCGRQSVDGDTAQVPPMLAERLGFAIKTRVMEFDGENFTLRGGEKRVLSKNTVLTFEKIRTLRFPSIFSKAGKAEIWNNAALQIEEHRLGMKGSPTRVIRSYESGVGRRNCRFVGADQLETLILNGLKTQKAEPVRAAENKLDTAYFVGNVRKIAESVAKSAIEICAKNKTAAEIAAEIQEKNAHTVLWESREDLKILAARTAVLTGAGLCADCISFRAENGKLVMTRPALGGNVTADIVCESQTAFATVRTNEAKGADVIFAIGKGAAEQADKIATLAKKYGAEVCCSRIVADSGILPYEKQVGLTGRTVSPKVYVAFGISGAVQHTCAIAGAGTVIAVNTDKNARIFDYADFGVVADISRL